MTLTPAERQANLGYFGPFMAAWRAASDSARAEAYADVLAYWRGELTPLQEVQDVSRALGLTVQPTLGA